MASPAWMLLLVAGAAAVTVACVSAQKKAPDLAFEVGREYELTEAVSLRQFGERMLVVTLEKSEAVSIAAGTTLRVVRVVKDNTLTRGIDYWPVAEVLDGEYEGTEVFLPERSRSMFSLK